MDVLRTHWVMLGMLLAGAVTIWGLMLTLRQNRSRSAPAQTTRADRGNIPPRERYAPQPLGQCERCGKQADDPGALFCGQCGGCVVFLPRQRFISTPRWNTQTRLVDSPAQR